MHSLNVFVKNYSYNLRSVYSPESILVFEYWWPWTRPVMIMFHFYKHTCFELDCIVLELKILGSSTFIALQYHWENILHGRLENGAIIVPTERNYTIELFVASIPRLSREKKKSGALKVDAKLLYPSISSLLSCWSSMSNDWSRLTPRSLGMVLMWSGGVVAYTSVRTLC